MVNKVIDNWFLIVILLAVIFVLLSAIYNFVKKPSDKQIEQLKHWVFVAVIEAEKNLGTKMGEVKLNAVYNCFVMTFPALAKLISFDTFKEYVEEALDKVADLASSNSHFKEYLEENPTE